LKNARKKLCSTTPHPPFGHLLPMPGEKGKMKKVIKSALEFDFRLKYDDKIYKQIIV
jgi:hypothetical protein